MRVRIDDIEPPHAPTEESESEYVPWRLVTPLGRESCRWQCTDGRWVALTLGHDEEVGRVVVTDSTGRRELVEAYESALTLARHWRS